MILVLKALRLPLGLLSLGLLLLFAANLRQYLSERHLEVSLLEDASELRETFSQRIDVTGSSAVDSLRLAEARLMALEKKLSVGEAAGLDSVVMGLVVSGGLCFVGGLYLLIRYKYESGRDLELITRSLDEELSLDGMASSQACQNEEFRTLQGLVHAKLKSFGDWIEKLNDERTDMFMNLERERFSLLERLSKKSDFANRAKLLNDQKGDFLAVMSHEIRTPMNGVLALADDLLSYDLEKELKEKVEMIKLSGESLVRILDDILDFSKIEAGKLGLKLQSFDFIFACRTTQALFKSRANEKGLDYTILIAADVPQYFLGDSVRVRQVMANLLSNAIKFTEVGGVSLSVVRETRRDTDGVLISVADTGMGIDGKKFDELFEAFAQAESGLEEKGTGLGLAISKKLAVLMDGELSYSANSPSGSVFDFWIPYLEGTPLDEAVTWPVETAAPVENAKVLIVEDNRINQHVIESLLERASHSVRVASNGLEALERVEEEAFDLIFMDCLMPKLDGFEAARRIRALPEGHANKNTPIIALTANAFAHDRELCFEAGMNDFLAKPVKKETLLGIVNHYCRSPAV